MAENLENEGCPQKDSVEHERHAGARRSFAGYGKSRDSAQRKTDTPRSQDRSEIYQSVYVKPTIYE